jgi:DNA-binding response OmpR family regulator
MPQTNTRSLNILVVDDEPSVAISVSKILLMAGHAVDIEHDGSAAMSKVSDHPDRFHLIITDHNMQGMTGLDVVKKLRETNFRGKIMVLSAWLTSELMNAYKTLMVDRIMDKPFDVFELREAVNAMGRTWSRN